MAAPTKSNKPAQPELGLDDIQRKRKEIEEARLKRQADEQAELDQLAKLERELASKNAEKIKRDVQIQLEEIAGQILPLINAGLWNWRDGSYDQSLLTMGLEPTGPKTVTVSDEFKKKILDALVEGELSLVGLARKLGEEKPANIRLRINQLVTDGVLKSKDDPAHSGKGRAPKLYLTA